MIEAVLPEFAGQEFTSGDLREVVKRRYPEHPYTNSWGSAINSLTRKGSIVQTGRFHRPTPSNKLHLYQLGKDAA